MPEGSTSKRIDRTGVMTLAGLLILVPLLHASSLTDPFALPKQTALIVGAAFGGVLFVLWLVVAAIRMVRIQSATSESDGAQEALAEFAERSLELESLDQILELSHEEEGAAAVSPAAEELMKIWGDMDAGLIKDSSEAFDEAEKRVRERQKASE